MASSMKQESRGFSHVRFKLGIFTAIAIIPIAESLVDILIQHLEILKIHSTKCVLKGNQEISEMQGEEGESTQCIGFDMPQEYYNEIDEED